MTEILEIIFAKFLTKLCNEELRNLKLSIKLNLLLILKLVYFSNPFGIKLNFPTSYIIRWESYFFRLWNTTGILQFNLTLILQFLYAEPFSDTTMIFYFNITINVIIITDPTFSRVLKIFIIFFGHRKFFVKMFFHHITAIFTFFNYTANKIVTSIFN